MLCDEEYLIHEPESISGARSGGRRWVDALGCVTGRQMAGSSSVDVLYHRAAAAGWNGSGCHSWPHTACATTINFIFFCQELLSEYFIGEH